MDFGKKLINIEEKEIHRAYRRGLTYPTEISDRFAATYNELFNFVGYDVNDMNTLFHEVCGDVVVIVHLLVCPAYGKPSGS